MAGQLILSQFVSDATIQLQVVYFLEKSVTESMQNFQTNTRAPRLSHSPFQLSSVFSFTVFGVS